MILEYRINSRLLFEETCSKIQEVVPKNGFAILAEIRTSEILKSKGFDYNELRTYDICNAEYASKALAMDQRAEVLLPCHLIVKRAGGHTEVAVQLPGEMFHSLHKEKSEELEMFLGEVESKLKGIVDMVNQ